MSYLLPPPNMIGAPDHFASWRPHQPAAVMKAIETDRRFVSLVLPTGAGKSLTVVGASLLAGWRTAILTSTKALQAQYSKDFVPSGMVDVRGKNSYRCVAFSDEFTAYRDDGGRWQSCDEGPCHAGMRCSRRPTRDDPDARGCEYYDAIAAAREARLVITNYKFWLANHYYGQGLGNFDCLVLDEAHHAPNELADFLSTTLSRKEIEGTLGSAAPRDPHNIANWAGWAKAQETLHARRLEEWRPKSKDEMREFRALKTVVNKLQVLGTMKVGDWFALEDKSDWHFEPVWVSDYAEQLLYLKIPKVLLTSATFTRKTADMMGVAPAVNAWHESPSDFPPVRRPIYFVNNSLTVRVTHRITEADEKLLVARIDQIIEDRGDRKGIIHTVSYKRRNLVLTLSKYRDRMLSHDTNTARSVVERFKSSPPGTILVSPSMSTGYDFPYSECEFQIIVKVPFPDGRDPILQARSTTDKDYGAYIAMQEIVQAVGRGMRAADDQCETFIIDGNMGWFLSKHRSMAPQWFMQAYKVVAQIPPPPAALETE
jgi:ATP-dependent DNA helicase DinG